MVEQYTARLEEWFINEHGSLCGYIYDDKLGRAPDGSPMRSSKVLPMAQQPWSAQEGRTFKTHNNTYLLGKPRGE